MDLKSVAKNRYNSLIYCKVEANVLMNPNF